MVVDNNTETSLFTIFDNTTVDTLAIDVDCNGIPHTVIDNATGGVTL